VSNKKNSPIQTFWSDWVWDLVRI